MMSTFLVLLLAIITINFDFVSSFPYIIHTQQVGQEKVFTQCRGNKINIFCYGTVMNGSKLELYISGQTTGCLQRGDCNVVMVAKLIEGAKVWTGYVKSDNGQTGGRFQAAFRNKKATSTSCVAQRGSKEATWPPGTFVLEGNSQTQNQFVEPGQQNTGSLFVANTGIKRTTRCQDSNTLFTKFEWISGSDPSIGGSTLATEEHMAYAVKVWEDQGGGARVYDGCVDFADPIKFFDGKPKSVYGTGVRGKVTEEPGEESSLLWLWILLGLLLLLLLLALLIWLCCCRKKDGKGTIQDAPENATSGTPPSAAAGSEVPSNKPTSVVSPKSSAKPGSSTVGAGPSGASTSLRSAYTNVPTGKSGVTSNTSLRSKMTQLQSSATQSKTGSKVGSKTGSSSKIGSKTGSKSTTPSPSSSSKSSTSKY